MKIFWLDDGIHLKAETGKEREALSLLFRSAEKSTLSAMFPSSGSGQSGGSVEVPQGGLVGDH